MKRQKRNFEKFDAFELYSMFTSKYNLEINNPSSVDSFLDNVKSNVLSSKDNSIVIHGKRIETLFAIVAGALGKVKIIKQEDGGKIYSQKDVNIPDYRIFLEDGNQILVEVKNFSSDDLYSEYSVNSSYYEGLREYSTTCNVNLYFAIYFRLFNHWCLVPIEAFSQANKKYKIDYLTAMARSEMNLIGDMMLHTTPDLELKLLADPDEAEFLTDYTKEVEFIPRVAEFYCNNNKIDTSYEQELAYYFMRFSDWPEKEFNQIIEDNKLLGLHFIYSYPLENDQPFAPLGWLSSMICNVFREITVKDEDVIATESFLNPSAFVVHIDNDYNKKYKNLPLWIFNIKPNYDAAVVKKAP